MTNHHEASTEGRRHMAAADRRTLAAIFRHPVAHNLSWMDALRLVTHLGSAIETADGKYSLTINGKHLIFHRPHGKHFDAGETAELRRYLVSAGISPENPYGTPPESRSNSVDVVALIDHHGAKLYRVDFSQRRAETVSPYDPHHFLHHLHHRGELREPGQRAPEDLAYYDRIAEALSGADRIVLLCHGTGQSNASQVLAERLKKYHPGIYARIVRQAEVNTSAMTDGQILAYARDVLATHAQGSGLHQEIQRGPDRD
jgi:hypothetical protein